MKKSLIILFAQLFLFYFFIPANIYSQSNFHTRGFYHPDSLTEITVTGTVIIDSSYVNAVYFLDENGDGISDYHLNFGPWWYSPDSSAAVRPADGVTVIITGGMHESRLVTYDVIVVYEINNNFWREPYEPYWNNLTHNHRRIFDRHNNCSSSTFGFTRDSLETVTITGTVMVDTTFYFAHYYLDEDGDQSPDYFLNFGPYWYEPESGAVRPEDGETVTLTGGKVTRSNISTIIVYEINGLVWREETDFSSNLGGGWLRPNADSAWFNNPYDMHTRIRFNSGWRTGGHQGGGMMFDSLYCQLLEVYPENVPNFNRERIFAGFEIGLFGRDGMNNMRNDSHCGGRMSFGSSVKLQLHYSDKQLEYHSINENSICAKYWDDSQDEWITVANSEIDYENNTVTFSGTELSSYVILAQNDVTDIDNNFGIIESNYKLSQNYPNPFNPTTTIQFSIPENGFVKLSVYDILGREVKLLINDNVAAGNHSIEFNAAGLSSGIYFYKLQTGNVSLVKKLNLLK